MAESSMYNEVKKVVTKNSYVLIFVILDLLVLIMGLLNITKVSLGSNIFGTAINLFSLNIWIFLFLMLAASAVLAYYEKFYLMFIPILIWLIFTTSVFRTANVPQLIDITTKNYTLGPDLDPFLSLRLAQEIAQGTLQKNDTFRVYPLGTISYAYQSMIPWTIVGLWKLLSLFSSNVQLGFAADILPVINFDISALFFFAFITVLCSFKFEKKKSALIALISTAFYVFSPDLIAQTTAGIIKTESMGILWIWPAFLFYALAWKQSNNKKSIFYGILAGIMTGAMAYAWGGFRYIFLILILTSFILFLFQRENTKNKIIFTSWAIPAIIIATFNEAAFSSNGTTILHRIITLFASSYTDITLALFLLAIFVVDSIIKKITSMQDFLKKIPRPVIIILITIVLAFIALFIVSPTSAKSIIPDLYGKLITPFGNDRIGITVAEFRAPYFSDVLSSFGELTWIFLLAAIVIFFEATKHFDAKKKIALNGTFIIFVLGFSLSRISASSVLNGNNAISIFLYLGSLILFACTILFIYFNAHRKNDEKTINDFKDLNFNYILILSFTFLAILSMRGALRLFYVIAPIIIFVSIMLPFEIWNYSKKAKDSSMRFAMIVVFAILILLLLGAFISFTNSSDYSAKSLIPSSYTQQWQKAMAWVRTETPAGSVFVHWWDYGYWVQTMGERPTVVDGGNIYGFWDYMVGRYVLTTPNESTALSFMKTHDVSYLLIDSSDIGKYGAFSSIGSNNSNDRTSYIEPLAKQNSQTLETKNTTTFAYMNPSSNGEISLMPTEDDIIYQTNGTNIILPAGKAGLGAILFEINNTGLLNQPIGIFFYNGNQYQIPLRYLYYTKLIDFGSGLDAGAYFMPTVAQSQTGGATIDNLGAVLYLNSRTVNTEFARLYLYGEENKYIHVAHIEDDPFVTYLKAQNAIPQNQSFVYYQGMRGPIKIWKVSYDNSIAVLPQFLKTSGQYGAFDNLSFTQ